MGIAVHMIVGDLDSISPEARTWAEESGTEFLKFPPNKDLTDLELALRICADRNIDRAVLIGGLGGRADHQMGNLLLLAAPAFAAMTVELRTATTTVQVIRPTQGSVPLRAETGDTVSLFAVSQSVTGLTTSGLQWELGDAVLPVGSSWTLSNVAVADHPQIALASGALLAFSIRVGHTLLPQ